MVLKEFKEESGHSLDYHFSNEATESEVDDYKDNTFITNQKCRSDGKIKYRYIFYHVKTKDEYEKLHDFGTHERHGKEISELLWLNIEDVTKKIEDSNINNTFFLRKQFDKYLNQLDFYSLHYYKNNKRREHKQIRERNLTYPFNKTDSKSTYMQKKIINLKNKCEYYENAFQNFSHKYKTITEIDWFIAILHP